MTAPAPSPSLYSSPAFLSSANGQHARLYQCAIPHTDDTPHHSDVRNNSPHTYSSAYSWSDRLQQHQHHQLPGSSAFAPRSLFLQTIEASDQGISRAGSSHSGRPGSLASGPVMASSDAGSDTPTTPALSSAASSTKSSATSSCSSSLRSVSFPDDESRDTVDFEDVALADDIVCINPNRRPTLRQSKTVGPGSSPRSTFSTQDALRYAASRNHRARNLRQSQSPTTPGMPSTSSPTSTLSPTGRSSSRPFPVHRSQTSPLQLSPRSPMTSPQLDNSPMLSSKRNSWMPNAKRKTAQELEAEYDQLDEDLPDDGILWNVPCLRPANSRSATLSPGPSTRRSAIKRKSPSISPRRSSPERGDLKERSIPVHKTKSWDEVMRDLSEDAQKLTMTLEYRHDHVPAPPPAPTRSLSIYKPKRSKSTSKQAEKMSENQPPPVSPASDTTTSPISLSTSATTPASASSPDLSISPIGRPGLCTFQRTQTVSIALPTIQTLSSTQDVQPPSKEKQRFLTRTRPSWLPPKSAKEERKHLREWEKMMRRTGADIVVQ